MIFTLYGSNIDDLNPFPTNPLVVVYGMGGADSAPLNISAPEVSRRLIFQYEVHLSQIYHQEKEF